MATPVANNLRGTCFALDATPKDLRSHTASAINPAVQLLRYPRESFPSVTRTPAQVAAGNAPKKITCIKDCNISTSKVLCCPVPTVPAFQPPAVQVAVYPSPSFPAVLRTAAQVAIGRTPKKISHKKEFENPNLLKLDVQSRAPSSALNTLTAAAACLPKDRLEFSDTDTDTGSLAPAKTTGHAAFGKSSHGKHERDSREPKLSKYFQQRRAMMTGGYHGSPAEMFFVATLGGASTPAPKPVTLASAALAGLPTTGLRFTTGSLAPAKRTGNGAFGEDTHGSRERCSSVSGALTRFEDARSRLRARDWKPPAGGYPNQSGLPTAPTSASAAVGPSVSATVTTSMPATLAPTDYPGPAYNQALQLPSLATAFDSAESSPSVVSRAGLARRTSGHRLHTPFYKYTARSRSRNQLGYGLAVYGFGRPKANTENRLGITHNPDFGDPTKLPSTFRGYPLFSAGPVVTPTPPVVTYRMYSSPLSSEDESDVESSPGTGSHNETPCPRPIRVASKTKGTVPKPNTSKTTPDTTSGSETSCRKSTTVESGPVVTGCTDPNNIGPVALESNGPVAAGGSTDPATSRPADSDTVTSAADGATEPEGSLPTLNLSKKRPATTSGDALRLYVHQRLLVTPTPAEPHPTIGEVPSSVFESFWNSFCASFKSGQRQADLLPANVIPSDSNLFEHAAVKFAAGRSFAKRRRIHLGDNVENLDLEWAHAVTDRIGVTNIKIATDGLRNAVDALGFSILAPSDTAIENALALITDAELKSTVFDVLMTIRVIEAIYLSPDFFHAYQAGSSKVRKNGTIVSKAKAEGVLVTAVHLILSLCPREKQMVLGSHVSLTEHIADGIRGDITALPGGRVPPSLIAPIVVENVVHEDGSGQPFVASHPNAPTEAYIIPWPHTAAIFQRHSLFAPSEPSEPTPMPKVGDTISTSDFGIQGNTDPANTAIVMEVVNFVDPLVSKAKIPVRSKPSYSHIVRGEDLPWSRTASKQTHSKKPSVMRPSVTVQQILSPERPTGKRAIMLRQIAQDRKVRIQSERIARAIQKSMRRRQVVTNQPNEPMGKTAIVRRQLKEDRNALTEADEKQRIEEEAAGQVAQSLRRAEEEKSAKAHEQKLREQEQAAKQATKQTAENLKRAQGKRHAEAEATKLREEEELARQAQEEMARVEDEKARLVKEARRLAKEQEARMEEESVSNAQETTSLEGQEAEGSSISALQELTIVSDEESKVMAHGALRAARSPMITMPNQKILEAAESTMDFELLNTVLTKTIGGTELHGKDFRTLLGNKSWLNDEVVNAAIEHCICYVNTQGGKAPKSKPKSAFVSSMTAKFLLHEREAKFPRTLSRCGVTPENFLEFNSIIIPLCVQNHWTLAVVRPSDRSVSHIDAMAPSGQASNAIIEFGFQVVKTMMKAKFNKSEWTHRILLCTQQRNSYDCGVHTIMNAICIALGIRPDQYETKYMVEQRSRIAAVLLEKGYEKVYPLDNM